jgi:DNA adenine methylase
MKLKTIFRYPGGKTKLSGQIVSLIQKMRNDMTTDNFTFVDVFAGGGSVSIGVMNALPSTKIVINDMDQYLCAFWKIMCSKESIDKLIDYVLKYKNPTVEDFKNLREEAKKEDVDIAMLAFLSIFFNRTTFSGIFASGPIGGHDQSGKYKIGCRYNAPKMADMIRLMSNTLSTNNAKYFGEDYSIIIEKYGNDPNALLYLDPPYMKQGKQLYNLYMRPEEYGNMVGLLKGCKAPWLISHDDYPDFVKLFDGWANIRTITGVPYTINSIKGKKRTELLITRN